MKMVVVLLAAVIKLQLNYSFGGPFMSDLAHVDSFRMILELL